MLTFKSLYYFTLLSFVLLAFALITTQATSLFQNQQDEPDLPRVMNVEISPFGEFSSTFEFHVTDFTNLNLAKQKFIWSLGGVINFRASLIYDSMYEYSTTLKDGTQFVSTEPFKFLKITSESSQFDLLVDFSLHDGEDEPFALEDIDSIWIRVFIHPANLDPDTKYTTIILSEMFWFSSATKDSWLPITPTIEQTVASRLVPVSTEKYPNYVTFYDVPASTQATLANPPRATQPTMLRSLRLTFPSIEQKIEYTSPDHFYELFSNATLKSLNPPFFFEKKPSPTCTFNGNTVSAVPFLSDITNNLSLRFMVDATFTTIPLGTTLIIDCLDSLIVQLDAVQYDYLQYDFVSVIPTPPPQTLLFVQNISNYQWVESWVAKPYLVDPNPDPEPLDPVINQFDVQVTLGSQYVPTTNLTIGHFPTDAGNQFKLFLHLTPGYQQIQDTPCILHLFGSYQDAQGKTQQLYSSMAGLLANQRMVIPIEFPSPPTNTNNIAAVLDYYVHIQLYPSTLGESWGLTKLAAESVQNGKYYMISDQARESINFIYNRPVAAPLPLNSDSSDSVPLSIQYYSANRVETAAASKEKQWGAISRQFNLTINGFQPEYQFDQLIVLSSATRPSPSHNTTQASFKIDLSSSKQGFVDCPVLNLNSTDAGYTNGRYGNMKGKLSPNGEYLQLYTTELTHRLLRGAIFTVHCPNVWIEADRFDGTGLENWSWAVTVPVQDTSAFFFDQNFISTARITPLQDGTDGTPNPYPKSENNDKPSNVKWFVFGGMFLVLLLLIAVYFIVRRFQQQKNTPAKVQTNILADADYALIE